MDVFTILGLLALGCVILGALWMAILVGVAIERAVNAVQMYRRPFFVEQLDDE